MSLPHRFSESAFRKYESIITEIAQRFPKVVLVDPKTMNLSSETVRGRLRDAITSAINNRWEKSTVNYGMLLDADINGLVVSLRPNGMVAVGTKETVKDEAKPMSNSIIESNEIFDATSYCHSHQIDFLAVLAAAKQLRNKVKITCNKMYAETLTEGFDIILEPTNNPDEYLLS